MNNNCQIFTPEKHVDIMLNVINYIGEHVLGKYILENSCGEGNILIKIVSRYIDAAKKRGYSKRRIGEDLEKYILGYEVDSGVREKCIKRLNSEILKHKLSKVNWNIKNEDYLKYPIERKVDFIVGNPPYIMYQNLDISERIFLKQNFTSCIKGKFDYCYAFIEKSIIELNETGKMSYIVPNSILKNVYGKELRNIIKHSLVEIYDYKESSVFGKVLTSPAIICLDNGRQLTSITYHDVDNQKKYFIDKNELGDKWLFSLNQADPNINFSGKFGDYFKVSNSVATLLNSAYLIDKKDIFNEDENYIELGNYRIEKNALRTAASPRGYSIRREEYIIFPYTYVEGKLNRLEEEEFELLYPGAYEYLSSFATKLNARKSDESAKWFEYGRSQALSHLNQDKLLLSSVVTNQIKSYHIDRDTIPYSGFYIIPTANRTLDEARHILESDTFFEYLSIRGINANGKSLRFSVKDILNYPLDEVVDEIEATVPIV